MIGPRLTLLATCLVLAACRSTGSPSLYLSASQIPLPGTGVLLDQGRPLPNIGIRVTSSQRPSHSMLATTDAQGRFRLDAAGSGRDVLRIEASGEDYHAVGVVPAGPAAITCEADASATYAPDRQDHFWNGNDIEWKPGRPVRKLNCR